MDFIIWILIAALSFFGISALRSGPPEVVTVQMPTTVTSKVNMDSALIIAYYKDGYRLSYLNDKVKTTKKADVQSFIKKYKALDPDKILVKIDPHAYKRFREIKEAFKANDIYKFRIVTNGDPVHEGSGLPN